MERDMGSPSQELTTGRVMPARQRRLRDEQVRRGDVDHPEKAHCDAVRREGSEKEERDATRIREICEMAYEECGKVERLAVSERAVRNLLCAGDVSFRLYGHFRCLQVFLARSLSIGPILGNCHEP
jgi:hypothetical protein